MKYFFGYTAMVPGFLLFAASFMLSIMYQSVVAGWDSGIKFIERDL